MYDDALIDMPQDNDLDIPTIDAPSDLTWGQIQTTSRLKPYP
jgi:hypothetical protein